MKLTHALAASALALSAAACGFDIPGPEEDTPIEIKLDFCANDTPVWFAVQTGLDAYQLVSPDAFGTFTFDARQRTGVVFVRENGSEFKTDMIFTTKFDLERISGLSCVEEGGQKLVNGSVSGLTGDNVAQVSMSFSSVDVLSDQPAFTLRDLVDRPLDVIASRYPSPGSEQRAERTVIRRAQSPANGATMSTINFDSEGFLPTTNVANVTGIGASDTPILTNNFFSQLETSHLLTQVLGVANGAVQFETIPSGQQSVGDYHDLFLVAVTSSGATRGMERFFTTPADQPLVLGPPLFDPLVSVAGTVPYVRMRTLLNGQLDYSTVISADYHQQMQFSTVDVSFTVTASFFGGTPLTWDLNMPNLAELEGWNNSWGLQDNVPVDWVVTGYFGRPELLFGARPLSTGDIVSFASRTSSISPTLMSQTRRLPPRLRHFSRLR